MQFDLFNTEETAIKVKQGEETFFCRNCKRDLPEYCFDKFALKQFRKKPGQEQTQGAGKSVYCKGCRREYNIGKRKAEAKAPPKPTSSTSCYCCGVMTDPKKLHLDHDHVTFDFRGWLCRRCNGGIGQLGDNIEGLEKAIAYLRKTNESRERS